MSDTIREIGTPARTSEVSQKIAAEIRAEAGRQGVSIREVARTLGVSQPWLARRVSIHADVDLKVNEIELIATALGTTSQRLIQSSGWLTHQYPSAQAA